MKLVFPKVPLDTPESNERFSVELAQSIAKKELGIPDAKITAHKVFDRGSFYTEYCYGRLPLVREIYGQYACQPERETYPLIGKSSLISLVKKEYCRKLSQVYDQEKKDVQKMIDTFIASVKM